MEYVKAPGLRGSCAVHCPRERLPDDINRVPFPSMMYLSLVLVDGRNQSPKFDCFDLQNTRLVRDSENI